MPLHTTEYDGEPALVYVTEGVEATVAPHIGAKVVSLIDRASGRELLWRQPGRQLRQPAYGDSFARYDISGWDECFPSIGPCRHPDAAWKGAEIPDHGELWVGHWRADLQGDDLLMSVDGVHFPYKFERRFQPAGRGLRVRYAVTNSGTSPLRCLWSMHPFLIATPTMRILLPEGVHIYVDQSKDARLGPPGTEHSWPVTRDASGQQVDLSVMGPREQGTIEKLFVHGLSAGWVAALDEATGDYTAFIFDHQQLPYVGMAINRGAWPDDDPAFTVILEPCSGWPDDLDAAIAHGAYTTLAAGSTTEWTVEVRMGQGKERLLAELGDAGRLAV